jgi:hypothetical protein
MQCGMGWWTPNARLVASRLPRSEQAEARDRHISTLRAEKSGMYLMEIGRLSGYTLLLKPQDVSFERMAVGEPDTRPEELVTCA